MSEYEYLTDQDKADIVAALKVELPDPVAEQLEAERNHYRETLRAQALGTAPPDPFQTKAEAAQAVIATIAATPEVEHPETGELVPSGDPVTAQADLDRIESEKAAVVVLDEAAKALPAPTVDASATPGVVTP